ncbi:MULTISPECIES: sterol desaturase family protein [Niastella]|uniref:Sterol desaturase family protein n=1 Tax=Niastella soli TaxID=2821487 RepID=A0ABS3YZY5_9BACT|nr:sterol desaturase family protein [Niastella soli]MBO9202676.1 sterol desaturase family protein [Niastella soli]
MAPEILYFAIPGFVVLLLLEAWYSWKEQKDLYEVRDTFSSLAMGIGNVISGFLSKLLVFGAFTLIYKFRLFTLPFTWWMWVLAFFADDLSYYWFHYTSHNIRWFWASHVVHHSSQRYNLSTALRQTWTGNLTGGFIFWMWMPFLGFHPIVVMLMQQISLIYQFWIHTEAVHLLPQPIEFIFNTPSHHRVHHGSNLKYLDKNHGGILIIWDRLFGTFQPEEERPTYGLTKNIETYNPVRIAFKEWGELFGSAWQSGSVRNWLNYFWRPPGWSHDGSAKTVREMREDEKVDRVDGVDKGVA